MTEMVKHVGLYVPLACHLQSQLAPLFYRYHRCFRRCFYTAGSLCVECWMNVPAVPRGATGESVEGWVKMRMLLGCRARH